MVVREGTFQASFECSRRQKPAFLVDFVTPTVTPCPRMLPVGSAVRFRITWWKIVAIALLCVSPRANNLSALKKPFVDLRFSCARSFQRPNLSPPARNPPIGWPGRRPDGRLDLNPGPSRLCLAQTARVCRQPKSRHALPVHDRFTVQPNRPSPSNSKQAGLPRHRRRPALLPSAPCAASENRHRSSA